MYRSRDSRQDAGMAADPPAADSTWTGPLRGEVVYLYAYDIAYDFRREPHELKTLLGVPIEQAGVDRSKRHPRLPQAVQARIRLPGFAFEGPHGRVEVHLTIKVL